MNVVDQLRDQGRVYRGWLGVYIQDLNQELAESFCMPRPRGALVSKVLPNSPASRAGFQVGDVVLVFDGNEVNQSADLPPMVGRTAVGKDVQVQVLREGREKALTVSIAELPDEEEIRLAARGEPGSTAEQRLGLTVADLTEEQRAELDVENNGVLVRKVGEGPASVAGIRPGDVLLMVNNVRIESTAQFKDVVEGLPKGKAVAVLVQRQGEPQFLAMRVPE
jgi:serine protease Do